MWCRETLNTSDWNSYNNKDLYREEPSCNNLLKVKAWIINETLYRYNCSKFPGIYIKYSHAKFNRILNDYWEEKKMPLA